MEALHRVVVGPETWGVPVFVVGEFIRLVTHPTLFEYPSSLGDAFGAIEGLVGVGGERLLRPGTRYWGILKDIAVEGHATANRVFDAQIAAVCLEHGATILTEDRGYRRFRGLTIRGLT